jgi:3,4-dihydroxy 2-butanone 4-phosphate synthase/GTP cyclohydrolase II
MMLPNRQETTSTIMRVRDCRSSYRRQGTGVVLDLNESRLSRRRLRKSRTVERVAEARLPTELGEFRIIGYRSLTTNEEFVVLVRGELGGDRATLVRIHSQCLTGDVFGSVKCDCGPQLRAAMEMIARDGRGVIVYQQQEGRGIGIVNKIRAYALQDEGADTIEANERLGLAVDLRCYEQCAEILRDLGLNRVRLMSNNPEKMQALAQMGLDLVERVSLLIPPTDAAKGYLRTKKERMGHLLELV